MKKWLVPLMLTLLFLWSCSESSLLLGEVDEPAQLELSTVPSGSILESGSDVNVRIQRDSVYTGDESTADVLVVELLDHLETLLAEQRFESVDQATSLPPVELPELAEGLYKLRLTYYDGEEIVAEETSYFFVAPGTYEIAGLSAYPASSYPEADGLLRVSLDIPAERDPFLVWRLNDQIIESGHLSQTGATIAVLAPASEGVFPVQVDLYPVWPEGLDPDEVEPATSYSAELFVSNAPSPARTDLLPEGSYFALYHLRGSLRDTGVRTSWFPSREFRAQTLGSPELAASSNIFGYRFDGASSLSVDGAVWPVFEGELSPVSVSFRLMPEELVRQVSLMRIELATTDLLTVRIDEGGRLGVTLPMLPDDVWTPLPVVAEGVAETVTVSIAPGAEQSTIGFFAGGQLFATETVGPISIDQLDSPRLISGADRWAMIDGTTYLGALEDGFHGVIDEFGVFFRDEENQPTTNTSLFQQSMQAEYGNRLLYAASFEEEAEADAVLASERARIADGAVELPGGEQVVFPPFTFEEEELVVRLELELPVAAVLELREPLEARDAHTGSAGTQPHAAGPEAYASIELAPAEGEQTVELVLRHQDGVLTLTRNGSEQALRRSVTEFSGVSLVLVVPPREDGEAGVAAGSQGIPGESGAAGGTAASGTGNSAVGGSSDSRENVGGTADGPGGTAAGGRSADADRSGSSGGEDDAGGAGDANDGARREGGAGRRAGSSADSNEDAGGTAPGATGEDAARGTDDSAAGDSSDEMGGSPGDADEPMSGGAATAGGAEDARVRVLSIVARRERPRIPDRLFDVSNE